MFVDSLVTDLRCVGGVLLVMRVHMDSTGGRGICVCASGNESVLGAEMNATA